MSSSPFRVLSSLHQASRQVAIAVDTALADLGVSGQEGQLLSFVALRDGTPVTDLVNLLGVPKSTMTSLLARLQRRRLIRRDRNPRDRRSSLIYATGEGAVRADQARTRVLELDRRIAGHLTGEDLEALRRLLDATSQETGVNLPGRVTPPAIAQEKST